ncbi:MAG: M48 family metallopeptidase, partial [Pseudomonadota bacterium]|nr:M48 family metallopeptidase [Pseudomonadota bacterium]
VMSLRAFAILLALLIALAAAIGLMAPLSDNAGMRANAQIAAVDDAWRAALPRDAQSATNAYMARLSPVAKARSDAYFEGGYWLQLWNFLATIAACLILLRARVLPRLSDWLTKRRLGFARGWIIGASFLFLLGALTAPLAAFQGFYREQAYGLANQSFGPWLLDQAIATALTCVIGGLFFAVVLRLLRKRAQTWWLWGSAVALLFMVIGLMLGPTYIDPLFNTYRPLNDGPIKQSILSMARANGVPADNVYQVDASRQSNRISANVSGIFGSAAVRLNDNLLKRTSLAEIKGVMGHELGHYVLNHIYKMLLAFGVLITIGFALLHWALTASVRRWGQRFGLAGTADPGVLPLLMLLLTIYFFVITPIMNSQVRIDETEADIFGLNASAEPNGFAEVDLKLTEYRKADPGEWEEFFFFDHPSPKKRIFSAMRWRAEHMP